GDLVIINAIRKSPASYPLPVAKIIELTKKGVSEMVLVEMQTYSPAACAPAQTPAIEVAPMPMPVSASRKVLQGDFADETEKVAEPEAGQTVIPEMIGPPTEVPEAPASSRAPAGKVYRVGPGPETLYMIAKRTLGNGNLWHILYRLNPQL